MPERFWIGQKVRVLGTKCEGEVEGIYQDASGLDYRVIYADSNGRFDSRYFKASQLKPVEETETATSSSDQS